MLLCLRACLRADSICFRYSLLLLMSGVPEHEEGVMAVSLLRVWRGSLGRGHQHPLRELEEPAAALLLGGGHGGRQAQPVHQPRPLRPDAQGHAFQVRGWEAGC